MEAFLTELLPRILSKQITFAIHTYQGKSDIRKKLPSRLLGYAKWLPETTRIIVVIDRDDDKCSVLKGEMEQAASAAGLTSRSVAGEQTNWQIANRIAVEELEAWFFGEWAAVRAAYPKVPANIPNKSAYRHPDQIVGGTWEALERVFKKAGYFSGGLRKSEAAREIGKLFDQSRATSPSFIAFRTAFLEATAS
jgi:hypothetical protein